VIAVDSSALVAIFRKEDDWEQLLDAIEQAREAVVSTASLAETLIVMSGRRAGGVVAGADADLRDFLSESGLEPRPVTLRQVWLANGAFLRFGKGRHKAALNFGDCFAYALARELDAPLLYKGNDFSHTDVRSVL
jgi:ribonuclease VapC